MADNKDNQKNGNGEPSGSFDLNKEVPVSNVVRKSEININDNVGGWGKTVNNASEQVNSQIINNVSTSQTAVVDSAAPAANTDSVTDETNKDGVKINFKKFEKQDKKALASFNSDNWFGRLKVSFNSFYINPKTGWIIWVSYLLSIILAITGAVLYIIFSNGFASGKWGASYVMWRTNKNMNYASIHQSLVVLSYISACLPGLPFAILAISWLVGINGVVRSVNFHFLCIFCFGISVIFLIVDSIMFGSFVVNLTSFHDGIFGTWPAPTAPAADSGDGSASTSSAIINSFIR